MQIPAALHAPEHYGATNNAPSASFAGDGAIGMLILCAPRAAGSAVPSSKSHSLAESECSTGQRDAGTMRTDVHSSHSIGLPQFKGRAQPSSCRGVHRNARQYCNRIFTKRDMQPQVETSIRRHWEIRSAGRPPRALAHQISTQVKAAPAPFPVWPAVITGKRSHSLAFQCDP
jgi:hypothetical protein